MERKIRLIHTGVRHKVEPGQGFPPLMEDTRENNLASVEVGDNEIVYVKAIAGPYVATDGLHVMVLPDLINHSQIREVTDISVTHLSKVLAVAGNLASHALDEDNIDEVNIGIHNDRDEWSYDDRDKKTPNLPKQKIKNFPNLHVHVEAANYKNKQILTGDQLRRNPEYFGKTPEPFEKIGYQILVHQILPLLRAGGLPVDDLFEEIVDNQGRLRFKLLNGSDTFRKPELALFLQQLDVEGQKAYDGLASCFFEVENGKFKVDDGQYQRYKLLPIDDRRKRIDKYIQNRNWLSGGSKVGLRLFTSMAQEAEKVIERELTKIVGERPTEAGALKLYEEEIKKLKPQIANRFMAFRGFSYATLFSGMKDENGKIDWTLGIRPSVFLVEGFVEMADTYGIIVKHNDQPYTKEELESVQARERRVISKVQMVMKDLKSGPGLENGI